jgi:hypothetical protein
VGPRASVFYISADAFYLWLNSSDWAYSFLSMGNGAVRRLAWRLDEERWDDSVAVVYRVPLDGSPVSVVQTFGEPINQFSFDGTPDGLRVFVEDWKEEQERREVYWLEIPMSSFSSTLSELPTERQHLLNVLEDGFTGQSRFIGPYLLYSEVDWTDPALDLWKLWVKRLDRDTPPVSFDFDTRRIQRIEPLGNHAVIIVEDEEDLDASTIWLGDNAQFGSTIFFPRAVEADLISRGVILKAVCSACRYFSLMMTSIRAR